jgi:hypothetical protein
MRKRLEREIDDLGAGVAIHRLPCACDSRVAFRTTPVDGVRGGRTRPHRDDERQPAFVRQLTFGEPHDRYGCVTHLRNPRVLNPINHG